MFLFFYHIAQKIPWSGNPDQPPEPKRFQADALFALQEAAEKFLVRLFEDAQHCAVHGKRITIFPEDFKLVFFIRGDSLASVKDGKRPFGLRQ